MGNFQGNGDKQKTLNIEHPRFKNARLSVDKKIVLEYKYNPQYIDSIGRVSSLNPQNKKLPLLLPQIQETTSENFCGIQKSMNLIFPFYKFTLHEQIARRKQMKLNFEQTQLWFLLYHLVSGSSAFQRKKQKSGDVRPRNILIDQKGDITLMNSMSFPDQLTNYYKSLYHNQKTYLSPEELAQLQGKVKYCKADPVIAESFSIGLTMMDATLLTDCEDLYDCQEISFKNYQFQDNLVAFKSNNMSPFYIKTVLNLLQVQSFNRPTPGEVLAIMLPYERDILQLIEFIPDREKSRLSLQNFQNSKN